VSDLTADDYARVATEIGMVCECEAGGFWREALGVGRSGIVALDADLPAYLAEPAQMVRILNWLRDHDHLPVLTLNPEDGREEYWICEMADLSTLDRPVFAIGQDPGEAVRDCAARALRP
jgi:hypothetical protein